MCGTITEETRVRSLVYRSLLSVQGRCLVSIAVDSFVTSFLQKDIHVQVDSEFVLSTKCRKSGYLRMGEIYTF